MRQIDETRARGRCSAPHCCRSRGTGSPDFVDAAYGAGLEPLVEVHNAGEADCALATRARLIGINNRNLATMSIDRSITRILSEKVRADHRIIVSESGMRSADDVREMRPVLRCVPDRIGPHGPPGTREKTGGVRVRVKICGITRGDDARFAENAGADAIGVVMFSTASPRSVPESRAREIFDALGPFVTRVIVTHTQSEHNLKRILALRPDAIQVSTRLSLKRIRASGCSG